jgi:hypothetical protein
MESISHLVQVMNQLQRLEEAKGLANDVCDDGGMEMDVARVIDEERPVLEITSRDRLDMLLASLPRSFHVTVAGAFGGMSLVDECAKILSRQLVAAKLPISTLKDCGYPADVVDAVKSELASAAIMLN